MSAPTAGATVALSATEATRIAGEDPAFSVPRRPRLLPGLVVVPFDGGLLVEGAERRQVFRGRAARTWLPTLVAALAAQGDAGTPVDELAARVGVEGAQAGEAIALLYAAGLLDDTPDRAPVPAELAGEATEAAEAAEAAEATATWVARHLDTSRLHRSRELAVAALAGTRVHVVGPAEAGLVLTASLEEHGVATTRRRSEAGLVVVVGVGSDDPALLADVEADCARRGASWLRVVVAGARVELGPVGGPDDRRCTRCLAAVDILVTAPGVPAASTLVTALAAAASEVVRLLSGSGRPLSTTGVLRLDLAAWRHELHVVPSLPGCPQCDPDGSPPAPGAEIVHVFDAAVRFPALSRQRPKDHQQHYAVKNLALQRDLRPRRRTSRALPAPPGPRTGVEDAPPRGLTAPGIAAVVHAGFGWLSAAGGEHRRCAPTGGNIGSPEAHLVVAGVPGLAGGRYRYDAEEHGLVPLDDDRPSATLWGAVDLGPGGSPLGPRALLVVTGDLERVSAKYVEFGARVVHLDAGVALAQARIAATAHGIRCRAALRWDDDALAGALGIDRSRTPVTLVAALEQAPTDPEGDRR